MQMCHSWARISHLPTTALLLSLPQESLVQICSSLVPKMVPAVSLTLPHPLHVSVSFCFSVCLLLSDFYLTWML